jgi:RNA polymerase sigma-70 factor (ECF subfamily)
MNNIEDKILIKQYLKGDGKSFEILVLKYLKPIYNFACWYIKNRQDAEDITQEVFIKVWRNLKKFDENKKFKAWIFQIAKNAALDFLKKKKEILFSEFENEQGENFFIKKLVNPSPLPNEILEKTEISQKLASIINELPKKYRIVLILHYNDHFTFKEISEILGEPLNTIKSRHQRTILILKKRLRDWK